MPFDEKLQAEAPPEWPNPRNVFSPIQLSEREIRMIQVKLARAAIQGLEGQLASSAQNPAKIGDEIKFLESCLHYLGVKPDSDQMSEDSSQEEIGKYVNKARATLDKLSDTNS